MRRRRERATPVRFGQPAVPASVLNLYTLPRTVVRANSEAGVASYLQVLIALGR